VLSFSGFLAILIKQEKIKDVIIVSLLFSVSFYTLGTWWLFTIEDKLSSILIVSFGTIALMSTYLIFSSIIIYVIANKSYIKFLFTAPFVLAFFKFDNNFSPQVMFTINYFKLKKSKRSFL
jgi:apolipoprotein N-acyltransferase